MAPLDPWIIEEIKKREEEKRRREEGEQPTVPADDPREIPQPRDERDKTPGPGYEMPNPNDPKREERPARKEESGRGVTIIDIGTGVEEGTPNVIDIGGDDDRSGNIDISKIPAMPPEDEDDKRSE